MTDFNKALTAKELISILNTVPPETKVHFIGATLCSGNLLPFHAPVFRVSKGYKITSNNELSIGLFGVQKSDIELNIDGK